jgi:4-diphosphocytidyl-2-C-methyl-D-erythritol kinase
VHLTRRAHAKLNLALSVGPPEPPGSTNAGMHAIASWMHAIDLHDIVHLTEARDSQTPSFEIRWADNAPRPTPIDWPPERDLALRALRLLEQTVGRDLPVSIRIEKQIPTGGGLGGGSSDAAAVFSGVNQLFSLGLSTDHLTTLSKKLGSDIAFFLGASPPAPALVRGMGDQIDRLALTFAGRAVILIFPTFGCPTGPVYKAYDKLGPRPLREREVRSLTALLNPALLFNDLLAPAEFVQPALRPLREAVAKAAGLPIQMSGSGSTLFLFPPSDPAQLAAKITSEVTDISIRTAHLV